MTGRAPNFKDITGQRFGMRVVVGFAGNRKNGGKSVQSLWLARCDCGDESVTNSRTLRIGKSCGCHVYKISGRCRRLPDNRRFRNAVLAGYKSGAVTRGLEWNLTDTEFDLLVSSKCTYCGSEPSNVRAYKDGTGAFHYNGIDRVDNTRGYETGNVAPCCFVCNRAKDVMTREEFVSWAKRVAAHSN